MLTPVHLTIDGGVLTATGVRLRQGQRRAGILAHWFESKLKGQGQTTFTGWLEARGNHDTYAPHTVTGVSVPRVGDFTWGVAVSFGSRLRYQRAKRAGDVQDGEFVRREPQIG